MNEIVIKLKLKDCVLEEKLNVISECVKLVESVNENLIEGKVEFGSSDLKSLFGGD